MVLLPELGIAHVWWARPADARPWLMSLFNNEERERLTTVRRHLDRQRFVVGCSLMRLLAGAYLGRAPEAVAITRRCQTCGGPHGKPRLGPPGSVELEFSVSHADDRVVVACSRRSPVGVDVEPLGQELQVDEMIELVVSAHEARAMAGLCPKERSRAFLVSWTRKEAVLKATGRGLVVPMPRVVVSAAGDPPRLIAWPAELGDARAVSMHDLSPSPGYVATLAVIGRCEEVVNQDGSSLLASSAASASP